MKRQKPVVNPQKKYCIKEICDLLCICRDTVRKYTNLDVIVPIRVTSREVYYLGSEVLILYDVLTNK
ncbi:MAG: hypothetical protein J1E63_03905 [Muribaculaceae bacterium]|nr:hypothetical protein [Muribaculaceae bacterium]